MVAAMPRFSKHRLANLAQFAQQVEVLHVAGADLEDVDVGQHGLDLGDLHDFADDQEIVSIRGLAQQLEAFNSHALEGIGRAARLEGAAAKNLGAGLRDLSGDLEDLLARLHRARSGHDHYFVAANLHSVG